MGRFHAYAPGFVGNIMPFLPPVVPFLGLLLPCAAAAFRVEVGVGPQWAWGCWAASLLALALLQLNRAVERGPWCVMFVRGHGTGLWASSHGRANLTLASQLLLLCPTWHLLKLFSLPDGHHGL